MDQHGPIVDRRGFLSWSRRGLGAVALASLLGRTSRGGRDAPPPAAEDYLRRHRPRAQRAIHVYLCGGLSQVDSFNYRPELAKRHGERLPDGERPDVFFGKVGLLRSSDWEFKPRGQSGLFVSELFPCLAERADDLTFIHSMTADTSNHTPATFQANTGFRLNGFPVVGSWLSYGLGAQTDELPAFVVLPDSRGVPAGGSINWAAGFLPARHQAVPLKTRGPAIDDLFPAQPIADGTERASRELLAELNERHLAERMGNDPLVARIKSYELAARMQAVLPEVADLDRETGEMHRLYGLDRPESADFGRGCLLARRLVEHGVRFVQIFSGGAFGMPRINWDGHEDMVQNHGQEAARIDRPVAGLLLDLKRRGLFDDTVVIFTSEFGRTPFTQSNDGELGKGRDHNQYGFSVWLAGAGLKPGFQHGATDEFGLKAVEYPVTWPDFHATLLALFGIDHERLTFYHNGINRRLTNVSGRVVREVLA